MKRVVVVLLVVAACTSTGQRGTELDEPEITGTAPVTETVDQAQLPPDFCQNIQAIIKGRASAFQGMLGGSVGDRQTEAKIIPQGFNQCVLEGGVPQTGRYVCTSFGQLGGRPELLEPEFTKTANAVTSCLSQRASRPHIWQAGEVAVFADGERQMIWRDIGPDPQQRAALKLEQDFITNRYYLRLELAPRSRRLPLLGS